jgi:hypothetical protein
MKKFGNNGMNEEYADAINHAGLAGHNLKMQHRYAIDQMSAEERLAIPYEFRFVPTFWNHSLLSIINVMANACGIEEDVHDNVRLLPEDNNERFFMEYFHQQENRNCNLIETKDKIGLCQCQDCAPHNVSSHTEMDSESLSADSSSTDKDWDESQSVRPTERSEVEGPMVETAIHVSKSADPQAQGPILTRRIEGSDKPAMVKVREKVKVRKKRRGVVTASYPPKQHPPIQILQGQHKQMQYQQMETQQMQHQQMQPQQMQPQQMQPQQMQQHQMRQHQMQQHQMQQHQMQQHQMQQHQIQQHQMPAWQTVTQSQQTTQWTPQEQYCCQKFREHRICRRNGRPPHDRKCTRTTRKKDL